MENSNLMPASLDPAESDEMVQLDREQAFLIFTTFCGDVARTAHALNVKPSQVARIAQAEGWMDKIRYIIDLKKSGRPGDMERAINRALCFVQAHRFRLFVDRCINRLAGMSEEDFDGYLFQAMPVRGVLKGTVQPGDRRVSLRAVADLASALEKVQTLCYQALNDTTSERIKRKDEGETDVSATEMHAKIAAALSKVAADDSLPARVFDGELAGAQERAAAFAAIRAKNPEVK